MTSVFDEKRTQPDAVSRSLSVRAESEYLFQVMSEDAPVMLGITDPEGQLIHANKLWRTFVGLTMEQAQGIGFADTIHLEDRENFLKAYFEAVMEHHEFTQACRMKRVDGVYRWFLVTGKPWFTPNGEFAGLIGSVVDITEQKEAEQSLRESQIRYHTILEEAPIMIMIINTPTGEVSYANRQIVEVAGQAIRQANFRENPWIHPDDQARFLHDYEQAFASHQSFSGEYRTISAKGDEQWVFSTWVPIAGKSGELTHYAGFFLDITRRKLMEESLIESEERFRTMADCSPMIIGTSDLRGNGLYFNKRWLEFTGKTMDESLGEGWLQSFHPDDFTSVWEKFSWAIEHHEQFEVVFRMRRSDGQYRWMWAKGAPRILSNGEFVGMVASCIDIHEQRQTAEENRKLTEELEQRVAERTHQLEVVNQELEAFSYSVSHDLRAPLRSVDGFSQAILEDYEGKLDDTGKQYLRYIREGSQQMAELIDDLLNLSRMTRGELRIEAVNLSELARDIVAQLHQESPERDVTLTIADDLHVEGDKRLLQAALQNLLENAWKFTSKHPTAHIEFGATQPNGKRVYFIKDDGAGFDMAYRDKLFRAFHRLHGPTDFPGTGIGLATVARIIHRHGGEVWAEGAVEKGATFYFTL